MTSSAPTQPKYKTVLFDMDGVLAEVSKSYRAAIILTCHHYGAKSVTDDVVTEWKIRGNANCDWTLSRNLILDAKDGRNDVTLEEVTETFENFYQGTEQQSGLYKLETLIPTRETLTELRKRSKAGMGIVTGRPRSDCMKFLKDMDLEEFFSVHHCAEDGPKKPDPFPVQSVCKQLGVEADKTVVLIGDTPDDIRAAVAAGCSGVGVTTPEAVVQQEAKGESHTLAPMSVAMTECGADVILPPGFAELVDLCEEA
eukprot:CAMPEP_0172446756 /NCGR_PEP_ID=MMETSP1065-20121228/6281_1 /TAXON_ID=265537 /ORGANISM="Amphiprora paludosa, Strain CCMP125" /LENGTH=254 /DNA_ID=CAMNT_0013197945 /DNA_START=149 /DNA_END=916 /DNA_ORIENTATION=-